jgi:hypothetical protein
MECLYHAVPLEMPGTVLVPLNELAAVSPEAFERQRSKYANREAVLDARITTSGLRFNDTVHCAPLHPHHLYRLRARMDMLPLARSGQARAWWTPGTFFEIPVERIHASAAFSLDQRLSRRGPTARATARRVRTLRRSPLPRTHRGPRKTHQLPRTDRGPEEAVPHVRPHPTRPRCRSCRDRRTTPNQLGRRAAPQGSFLNTGPGACGFYCASVESRTVALAELDALAGRHGLT